MACLPHRTRVLSIALACAASLAACGGGGSSGGDDSATGASAGSDISTANYTSFTTPLARTVVGVSDSAGISSLIGGGGAQAAAARSAIAALQAGRSAALAAGHSRPQAVATDTLPCDAGGSITVTVNDGNNNNRLDNGDTIAATLNACRLTSTEPAGSGSFTMIIDSVTLDGSGYPSAMAVHGSFDALTAGAESMNGGFQMSASYANNRVDISMDLSDMTGTVDGQRLVYNTSLSARYDTSGNGSFTIDGRVGINGETYLLQQVQPFAVSGEVPVGGSLRLSDAAGDALLIEAQTDGTVDFAFYPAGATTATATLTGQAWSQYGG